MSGRYTGATTIDGENIQASELFARLLHTFQIIVVPPTICAHVWAQR